MDLQLSVYQFTYTLEFHQFKIYTPVGIWVVKSLTKIAYKYGYFLLNRLKIKHRISQCNMYTHHTRTYSIQTTMNKCYGGEKTGMNGRRFGMLKCLSFAPMFFNESVSD